MSVGLGNIWRFPYIAYKNGGGAFLIPYLIILIFIGRPLYFLEMVLGQFSSSGSVKVYNVVPFARGIFIYIKYDTIRLLYYHFLWSNKGIGYGQAIATWCVVTYYVYLMALAFYFLFSSFQETLPWTYCNPEWANNETCYDAAANFSNFNVTENMRSSSYQFFK